MKIRNLILEKIFIKFRFGFIFCNICGRVKKIIISSENLRESALCNKCKSNSRKRHLAAVILETINAARNTFAKSLKRIPSNLDLNLYNLESNGALHRFLKHTKGYTCSEYFGSYEEFGREQNGIMNVDLMHTPFSADSFNYLISTEVFEHIPDPYKAFQETYRILKKGGAHIFTVPYDSNAENDEVRAVINAQGKIEYLMKPQYHGDPVRESEGILVFTIFSKEMITKLENIGFGVTVDTRRDIKHGIIGGNSLVFTATKN